MKAARQTGWSFLAETAKKAKGLFVRTNQAIPHPSSDSVMRLVQCLEAAIEASPQPCLVDMKNRHTYLGEACQEDPPCHSGWYAISQRERVAWEPSYHKPGELVCDFTDAAILMAEDLGFADPADLLEWAIANPDLWGGEHGVEMLRDNKAFGIVTNGPYKTGFASLRFLHCPVLPDTMSVDSCTATSPIV